MKKYILFILTVCLFTSNGYSQIKQDESLDIFRRLYNQEITYYASRKYVFTELFKIEHNQLIDATLKSVTGAKSGELTTLVYHSDDLKRQGLIFTFWNDRLTELNLKYDGYGFRHFELSEANNLLNRLVEIIKEKKSVLEEDNNAAFQYEDVTFVFSGNKDILVLWQDFSANWTEANLNATINRVNTFLKKKNK
jgi:hypothetical protein